MEYKGRDGEDKGRSVTAKGFWGDIVNSPYHCFGTICEEPRFFETNNGLYTSTAVDVAEHNVRSFVRELRGCVPGDGGQPGVQAGPKGGSEEQGEGENEGKGEGEGEDEGEGGGEGGAAGGREGVGEARQEEGESEENKGGTEEEKEEESAEKEKEENAEKEKEESVEREKEESAEKEKGESAEGQGEESMERERNAEMWRRLRRARITLLTGDVSKVLGRRDLAGKVGCVTIGRSDLHAVRGKGLAGILASGGVVCVESAKVTRRLG